MNIKGQNLLLISTLLFFIVRFFNNIVGGIQHLFTTIQYYYYHNTEDFVWAVVIYHVLGFFVTGISAHILGRTSFYNQSDHITDLFNTIKTDCLKYIFMPITIITVSLSIMIKVSNKYFSVGKWKDYYKDSSIFE